MRVKTWLAGAAAIALLATGCGGGATTTAPPAGQPAATTEAPAKVPAADQLLQGMLDSFKTAQSARVSGEMAEQGQAFTFDLAGDRAGTNQEVKIEYAGQGNAEIRTVDGQDYIKGDKTFWTSQGGLTEDQAAQVEGKYIAGPAEFAKNLNVGMLLDEMQKVQLSVTDRINTKVEEDTVEGQKVWKLTQRIGGDDSTVWISADGKNHLVKITTVYEGAPMDMNFAEWDAVQPFEAPPADQVLRR